MSGLNRLKLPKFSGVGFELSFKKVVHSAPSRIAAQIHTIQ